MKKILQNSIAEWRVCKLAGYALSLVQFRLYGVKFGSRLRARSVCIHNIGSISIGDATSLTSFPDGTGYRCSLRTYFADAVIEIGRHCVLNGAVIHSNSRVSLGDWVMLGPGTIIVDNDSHPPVRAVAERFNERAPDAPIHLSNNVWIGMRTTIMKGVTIGENTIVAAGSLVTRSLPANVLAAGVPAKVLRDLPESMAELAVLRSPRSANRETLPHSAHASAP